MFMIAFDKATLAMLVFMIVFGFFKQNFHWGKGFTDIKEYSWLLKT